MVPRVSQIEIIEMNCCESVTVPRSQGEICDFCIVALTSFTATPTLPRFVVATWLCDDIRERFGSLSRDKHLDDLSLESTSSEHSFQSSSIWRSKSDDNVTPASSLTHHAQISMCAN